MKLDKQSFFKVVSRRCVTLIEMMIVMFLIALITGVVAYNYRGSMDEGKAFKTKAGIDKLQTILSLAVADNPDINLSGEGWKEYIRTSPLVQNASALIKDGWGSDYTVNYDASSGSLSVTSSKYEAYISSHSNTMFGKDKQNK